MIDWTSNLNRCGASRCLCLSCSITSQTSVASSGLLHRFRKAMRALSLVVLIGLAGSTLGAAADSRKASVSVSQPKADENGLEFSISLLGDVKIRGRLGLGLPLAVGQAVDCSSSPGVTCFEYGDFAKLTLTEPVTANDNCAEVEWTSTYARELQDCFTVDEGMHMYGGGETLRQYWPINQEKRNKSPYVTGDFLQGQDVWYGGVVENYWIFSNGVAIHVNETTPLFMSYDTDRASQLCFYAADQEPFKKRDQLTLKYSVCVDDNVKAVHQTAIRKYYDKPEGLVDEKMLLFPLWCTWAQYKTDVNQEKVLEYARRVVSEGFLNNSHIEIDDHWETCYGNEEFNLDKFPDPAGMVRELKALDMRVTVWVHPFVNYGCSVFNEGVNQGLFVKDPKDKTGLSGWWQGNLAGVIDVTNEDAVAWWHARLDKLKTDIGIDAFKFDAGETIWLPSANKLTGNQELGTNDYTTQYINAIASYGGLVEARSARRTQRHAIFTRMLDKDSNWGYDNGLKSMIPTLLYMGVVGYPFTLPDMIGGNAYGEWPSKELFIRWLGANVFMPSVQFSITPWDDHYDAETVEITKRLLAIRAQYHTQILAAANQAVADGSPINRPLWWVDPTDPETFTIDSEFMLGDTILAAPVLEDGARTRDIYLPAGTWVSGTTGASHTGPTWLRDYAAPLDSVPHFIKQ